MASLHGVNGTGSTLTSSVEDLATEEKSRKPGKRQSVVVLKRRMTGQGAREHGPR